MRINRPLVSMMRMPYMMQMRTAFSLFEINHHKKKCPTRICPSSVLMRDGALAEL